MNDCSRHVKNPYRREDRANMVRAIIRAMLNPLRLPRVLKDSLHAMQASLPHGQKAAEANGEWLELVLSCGNGTRS
jgi:hypothetical protein